MDRRAHKDRREHPTRPLSLASLRGRRREIRRTEDSPNHLYVDRYGWKEFIAALAIPVLCVLDAFFTLELISKGGVELNPIMAALIKLDPIRFLEAKYVLTSIGVVWLLIHKNYRIFNYQVKTSYILGFLALMYGTLVAYELHLVY